MRACSGCSSAGSKVSALSARSALSSEGSSSFGRAANSASSASRRPREDFTMLSPCAMTNSRLPSCTTQQQDVSLRIACSDTATHPGRGRLVPPSKATMHRHDLVPALCLVKDWSARQGTDQSYSPWRCGTK